MLGNGMIPYRRFLVLSLMLGLLACGCFHTGTSHRPADSAQTYYLFDSRSGGYPTGRIEKNADGAYYVYDSKAGGYPSGRIEKKGNTYYLYNGKSGGYPVGRVMRK